MANRLYTWEENTERRVGIVEAKVDKMLDPEHGIYSKLNSMESRLKTYGITILTAIVVSGVVQMVSHS